MIEDLAKAALLGAVQGLTEFLPVSSTGHLVLVEHYLGIDQERYGLPFDAALHLGTLLSVLLFFGATWLSLVRAALRSLMDRSLADSEAQLAWLIVLGTLPAALAGFFFESTLESSVRSPAFVAVMLIVFSVPFVVAERWGARTRAEGDMTWRDSAIIGAAQAVALVPGVSRSGMTMSAGLLRDLDRAAAARFAFLLSAPIIAGAGLKQLADTLGAYRDGLLNGDDLAFFATGFVVSTAVGYAAIAFLMGFLVQRGLMPFVWYRVGLGAAVLLATGVAAVQG